MTAAIFQAIVILVILVPATLTRAAVIVSPPADAIEQFAPADFTVCVDRAYDNPFDPDEIAIDAEFVSPDNRRVSVPAFWWAPPTGQPGEPGFRVRFAPPAAGKWTMTVTARDRGGERRSEPVSLEVKPGASRGFVRRSPDSRQYFQRDDGSAYFPIGLNIAWVEGSAADAYAGWFEKLSRAGGNFARVWMCHGGVYIEHGKSGLGRIDPDHAAYVERVLELARKHDIGVMLCFINHREFLDRDMWGEADWPRHVYNAANGGPATRPVDFFTGDASRKLFKRRLRYIVARYSAYTSAAFWELINEQEHIPVAVPDEWNCEMAGYLKQVDPMRRPVTTSASCPPGTWRCDHIDLTQSHLYGDGEVADGVTPILNAIAAHRVFGKPHLIAEYGISFKGPDAPFDPRKIGTALHNSLWAAACGGAAGTAAHWWWDNYIDPQNQWHHYIPISKFAAAIDWPRRNFQPISIPPPQIRDLRHETFTDLSIDCTGGFARSHGELVTVAPNGAVNRSIPRFHFGPTKPDMQTRARIAIDMPADGEMVLRIGDVSDYSLLRVWVDDKPTADFLASALPGSADVEKTQFMEHLNRIYQARINKDRRVPLSKGRRTIEIANLAGDWVTIESITFTNARSSRYDNLAAVATRDEPTGETLAWLYDVTSNWKSDRDGEQPREHRDISLKLPARADSPMVAEWWDTWRGVLIHTETVHARGGMVDLSPPPFTRDIAVRLRP